MNEKDKLRKPIYGEEDAKLGDNSFQFGNDATSFLDIAGLDRETNVHPDKE